jgi:hypothetical protein
MECCSFIRKSETMSFAVRLEKLGNIMTHKDKYHMLSVKCGMWVFKKRYADRRELLGKRTRVRHTNEDNMGHNYNQSNLFACMTVLH